MIDASVLMASTPYARANSSTLRSSSDFRLRPPGLPLCPGWKVIVALPCSQVPQATNDYYQFAPASMVSTVAALFFTVVAVIAPHPPDDRLGFMRTHIIALQGSLGKGSAIGSASPSSRATGRLRGPDLLSSAAISLSLIFGRGGCVPRTLSSCSTWWNRKTFDKSSVFHVFRVFHLSLRILQDEGWNGT